MRFLIRFLSYLALLAGTIFLPWWCTLILATIFIFYFENYFEVFAFAFFMDALYSAPVKFFGNFMLVATLSAVIMFILINFFKRRLKFYD